jgi:hypothetical protein
MISAKTITDAFRFHDQSGKGPERRASMPVATIPI